MLGRWLRKILLVREIASKAGDVHFRRYRLIQTPWFALYVHHILIEDRDRHRHSHPWSFWGLILRGGYRESLSGGAVVTRRPGSLAYRRAEDFHKVEELLGPTWSLCLVGRRRDTWGYETARGFVDHELYRHLKQDGHLRSLDE
jgi:hypothetical protein